MSLQIIRLNSGRLLKGNDIKTRAAHLAARARAARQAAAAREGARCREGAVGDHRLGHLEHLDVAHGQVRVGRVRAVEEDRVQAREGQRANLRRVREGGGVLDATRRHVSTGGAAWPGRARAARAEERQNQAIAEQMAAAAPTGAAASSDEPTARPPPSSTWKIIVFVYVFKFFGSHLGAIWARPAAILSPIHARYWAALGPYWTALFDYVGPCCGFRLAMPRRCWLKLHFRRMSRAKAPFST